MLARDSLNGINEVNPQGMLFFAGPPRLGSAQLIPCEIKKPTKRSLVRVLMLAPDSLYGISAANPQGCFSLQDRSRGIGYRHT